MDMIQSVTAFAGLSRLASGPLPQVAIAIRHAAGSEPILVFDDATGRVIDLDLRGSDAEIVARLPAEEARGRGRPKLGVIAREVTLLPRHWDWLATQSGGASAALRRLVEEARKTGGTRQERRAAQEVAYRFLQAIAGDLPGYEESTRALFADDRTRFEAQIAGWPDAIRAYALKLAFGA
ncbi:MAG: hypothetical protein JWO65_1640 [Sphingomonas bacterium]|jgi:hypothetical protein|nr:hypothetical protein [Sphingomonas bacterium]